MSQYKHGMAHKNDAYGVWVGMRQRCNNVNHSAYQRYGGAGISVCDRWNKFEDFLADMGGRPKGATIERIDNTLGYYKENCRWATYAEQSRNRSMTVWIEYNGEKLCVTDWANRLGLSFSTMKERLQKWGVEKALSTPKINNQWSM